MNALEWFIALRYLISRERRGLVAANTFISVAGVAVGVAVLIATAGIMDGAIELLFSKITGLYPHLTVTRFDQKGETAPVDEALAAELRRDPRVLQAVPAFRRTGMIQPGAGIAADKQMVQIIAMAKVGAGSPFEFEGPLAGREIILARDEILIGQALAEKLELTTQTQVILFPFHESETINALPLRPYRVKLAPRYQTGYYEFDANTVFVGMADARKMFSQPAGADYIHVKLADANLAAAFRDSFAFPPEYHAVTWQQNDADFFKALAIQKYMLFIIMLLIVVVAAFNIIGTLILMVTDKTREIGILKATGMRGGSIARIFLLDGALIGSAGAACGIAIGLLVSAALRLYHFPMPASVYNFSTLPVRNDPVEIAVIALAALAICAIASVLPAVQAARLRPVEALRYE